MAKTYLSRSKQFLIQLAGPRPFLILIWKKQTFRIQKKGIAVNEYLQSTSNPRIYAAGDAADTRGLPLTPVAVLEGHTLASNIIKGNKKRS